ncbi:hypothetical protein CPC08DRAFT_332877 [Agrocybe pediades]|nr:hypothetical protein CPC08DRAFT_332877 [Agrocybe pediades]
MILQSGSSLLRLNGIQNETLYCIQNIVMILFLFSKERRKEYENGKDKFEDLRETLEPHEQLRKETRCKISQSKQARSRTTQRVRCERRGWQLLPVHAPVPG